MGLKRIIAVLGLFLWGVIPAAGLTHRDWADPLQSLARSSSPLKLASSFLVARDTGTVHQFRESLIARGKPETANQIWFLEELFAGNNAGAAQALELLDRASVWTEDQEKYLSRLTEIQRGFEETKSDMFHVRTSSAEAFLSPYVLAALENAQSRVAEFLGSSSTLPVPVEIYTSVDDFVFASGYSIKTLERTGVVSAVVFGRVMAVSPGATVFGYRWIDALVHEHVHASLAPISGALCPNWLQEGTARYLELLWRHSAGFVHPPRDRALLTRAVLSEGGKGLLSFHDLDVSFRHLSSPDQVDLALAQVADVVHFIVNEFGEEKLRALLRSFRESSRSDGFRLTLGISEGELEKNWRDSLADLTENPTELERGALGSVVRFGFETESPLVVGEVERRIRLGDGLRKKGASEAAVLEYKKAVEFAPDNGVALARLAGVYQTMGRTKSAEELLVRATAKNPAYVVPFVLLGELYFEQGRYEETQGVLQQALEINPFDSKIHELLGLIAVDVGNFALARQSLELALRFDPDNDDLRRVLRRMPKGR
ncbi:MAG: tetratricopeptide repeat protein [Elusimicrobia bacterium]|nr:tetratricopeptide repeat protein [Elusimicrobiota bacterium]